MGPSVSEASALCFSLILSLLFSHTAAVQWVPSLLELLCCVFNLICVTLRSIFFSLNSTPVTERLHFASVTVGYIFRYVSTTFHCPFPSDCWPLTMP